MQTNKFEAIDNDDDENNCGIDPKKVLNELINVYKTKSNNDDDDNDDEKYLHTIESKDLAWCIRKHGGNKTKQRQYRRIAQTLNLLNTKKTSKRPQYTNACSEFRRRHKRVDKKRTRVLRLDRSFKNQLLYDINNDDDNDDDDTVDDDDYDFYSFWSPLDSADDNFLYLSWRCLN